MDSGKTLREMRKLGLEVMSMRTLQHDYDVHGEALTDVVVLIHPKFSWAPSICSVDTIPIILALS